MFALELYFFLEGLGVFWGVQSGLDGFKLLETAFVPSSDFIVFSDSQAKLQLSVLLIGVNLLFVLINHHA